MKPHTVQEIADKLNLSSVTVSSVLNNKAKERGFADSTIKRVLDYVKEIDFHQDIGALAMRGKYSKDIGIVFSYNIYPANQYLYFSLAKFLKNRNIFFESFYSTPDNLGELIRRIDFFRIKRLIVIASHFLNDEDIKYMVRLRRECKNIQNCYFYDVRPRFLNCKDFADQDAGSYVDRANRVKLIAGCLKRKKYAKVILHEPSGKIDAGEWNATGLEIEFIPLEYPAGELSQTHKESLEIGRMIATQYSDYRFDRKRCCFYTHDDFIAAGMLKQFIDDKFSIPKDFGVLSWDNLPESEYFSLPLTSFGLPHDEMFEHICAWVDGKAGNGLKKFKIAKNNGKTI